MVRKKKRTYRHQKKKRTGTRALLRALVPYRQCFSHILSHCPMCIIFPASFADAMSRIPLTLFLTDTQIKRADKIGVSWNGLVDDLKRNFAALEEEYADLDRTARIVTPEYYKKPFHAYKVGKLTFFFLRHCLLLFSPRYNPNPQIVLTLFYLFNVHTHDVLHCRKETFAGTLP